MTSDPEDAIRDVVVAAYRMLADQTEDTGEAVYYRVKAATLEAER